MSEIAVQAEGLGKRYRIGELRAASYSTLREAMVKTVNSATAIFRRKGRSERAAAQDILWALQDVSFKVEQGEVIGIIGPNGAGKSTLLKVLSRITEPTVGYADVHGRLGALLEVGTGFHPELTGRDNIILSGAILGMKRAEIRRRFDEIVAFAEVERFVDTPVKHYSSGMYLRLAFAVAAHFDPDVLVVDEVLAVGDAGFQKKCLQKLEAVSQTGRTVFFVSHDLTAIARLCKRAILLKSGHVLKDGPTNDVISLYLSDETNMNAVRQWPADRLPGDQAVRLREVRVHTEDNRLVSSADIRQPIGIDIEFDVLEADHILTPNLHVIVNGATLAFITNDLDPAWRRKPRPIGRFRSTAWIPGNFMSEGYVSLHVALSDHVNGVLHAFEQDVVSFNIIDTSEGDGARGDHTGALPGTIRPILRWTNDYFPIQTTPH